jgi:hypothetical protein
MSRSKSRGKTFKSKSKGKTFKGSLTPSNRNSSSDLPTAPFDIGGAINTPEITAMEIQQRTIDGQLKIIANLTDPKPTSPPPMWAQLLNYGYFIVLVALTLIALSYFLHGRYPESTASEDLARLALSTMGALLFGMARSSLPGNK